MNIERFRGFNQLLTPVDACGFLEQFEFRWEAKQNLHGYRRPVLGAINEAVSEPARKRSLKFFAESAN